MTYEPWKYDYRVQTVEEKDTRGVLIWQWRYGDWDFEEHLHNEQVIERFFAEKNMVDQRDGYAYWR